MAESRLRSSTVCSKWAAFTTFAPTTLPAYGRSNSACCPRRVPLGLTLDDLARQTRDAVFGAEALRVQRGREEVRVYVRLPEDQRNSITDIESSLVRAATGAEVPVSRVATGRSPTAIHCQDGQRVVRVSADVDAAVISGGRANGILEDDILAALVAEDPELTYSFGGEQQQQLESMRALGPGFGIVMVLIFSLRRYPCVLHQTIYKNARHPVRPDRGDRGCRRRFHQAVVTARPQGQLCFRSAVVCGPRNNTAA